MSDTGVEPAFVGAGRRAIVDGLIAAFDQVRTTERPLWVSIEAPSGWGKTRIAREFYARLASERQSDPPYWPGSILDGASDVQFRRKRVHPTVTHVAGSLPDFMWWGISCSLRDGVASAVLTEDMGQFRAHAAYLEDAWRTRAPRSSRITAGLRAFGGAAVDEAAMEVAGQVVESVVGAAIPGLGLVRWLGERSVDAIRDTAARRERLSSEAPVMAATDFVDEAVALVSRLAIPELPVVVFVEDLHDADPTLVEMLVALASRPGAVLVVSTSWPGSTEANPAVAAAFAQLEESVIRVSHRSGVLPMPFRPEATLDELDAAALGQIVRFTYPEVEAETLQRIVERYPNPLALELFCELPRIRRRSKDGALTLSAAAVAEAPGEIRGLYQELWRELPERLREALTLAALGAPARIGEAGVSSHWHTTLLLEALHELDWPSVDDIAAALDFDAGAYAWVREVSGMLRAFHEPDQIMIAAEDDRFLSTEDRIEVRTALAQAVTRLADGSAPAETVDEALHLADLVGVLFAEGFLTDSTALAVATLPALRILATQPRELRRTIDMATRVIDALGGPESLRGAENLRGADNSAALEVWDIRGDAQYDLGLAADAERDYRVLVDILTGLHGPDHPSVLRMREGVVRAVGAAGRVEEALRAAQTLVDDRSRVLGRDHSHTLRSRATAAHLLGQIGRYQEALDAFVEILADSERVGVDAEDLLDIRHYITATLDQLGRLDEALAELQEIVRQLRLTRDEDDPRLLLARGNLAATYLSLGRYDTACTELVDVATRRARVLGDTHPHTLATRSALAYLLVEMGSVEDGLRLYVAVLTDRVRVLGPDHPETLESRAAVAMTMAGLEPLRAVESLESVAQDRVRLHGPDNPETLLARSYFARALQLAGRGEEALAAHRRLRQDRVRVMGADSADALSSRHDIALALEAIGRREEALEEWRALLDDRRRVLGAEHFDTLATRYGLANALLWEGRYDEALAEHLSVLAPRVATLGPDHPDTLLSRSAIAWLLSELGRVDEAVVHYDGLVELSQQTFGPDHPRTLSSRHNRAFALEGAGRVEHALDEARSVLADRRRVLGSAHDETVESLHALAAIASRADLSGEAAQVYLELLELLIDRLGDDHAEVLDVMTVAGRLLVDSGAAEYAVPLHAHVRDTCSRVKGDADPETLDAADDLAIALRKSGRHDESCASYESFLPTMAEVLGETHASYQYSLAGYASALRLAGREVEADAIDARLAVNDGE
ncbi:MAG: tetratricopeptide repeat protein [Candidatus Microbacterium phytovorans]|uniref:Tetratricopeptide repeat protein n=1 Tax=Candidatus Microbacterium phytovorans TaxID=3121374 RepID=A0AAJ6B4Y9_9MICO|nr:ATP-binding protein [Microbacterium sp.]WEK14917.1 MAG: tetratricopeptide repeat protein [Microbacterium sp.]